MGKSGQGRILWIGRQKRRNCLSRHRNTSLGGLHEFTITSSLPHLCPIGGGCYVTDVEGTGGSTFEQHDRPDSRHGNPASRKRSSSRSNGHGFFRALGARNRLPG